MVRGPAGDGYARSRNYLATDGTSPLSPYLRFELVSPRQVAAAIGRGPHAAEHPRRAGGRATFVNELLWRDFYGYVLYHRPESVTVRNARLLRRAADSPQRSCGR